MTEKKVNRADLHWVLVSIEICALVFIIMIDVLANMIGSAGVDMGLVSEEFAETLVGVAGTLSLIAAILFVGTIIHIAAAIFMMLILKKNVEIAVKSRKNFRWTVYFSQFSRVVIDAYAPKTVPRRRIDVTQSYINRVLTARGMSVVKDAIASGLLPNIDSDWVFSDVFSYLNDNLTDDKIQKLMGIDASENEFIDDNADGDEVIIGPGDVLSQLYNEYVPISVKEAVRTITANYQRLKGTDILPTNIDEALMHLENYYKELTGDETLKGAITPTEADAMEKIIAKYFELKRDIDSYEVALAPYLQPLLAPINLAGRNEIEGFDDQGEFEALIRNFAPNSVIIWEPEGLSEIERNSSEPVEELDDVVHSYAIDGTYFYIGSAAGIPILLDIMSLNKLQQLYHMRIRLSGIQSLRMKALIYIILALVDKSNRQRDVEERTEISRRQAEYNSEYVQQQWMAAIDEIQSNRGPPRRQVQVMPKKVDLTHITMFVLGVIVTLLVTFAIGMFSGGGVGAT